MDENIKGSLVSDEGGRGGEGRVEEGEEMKDGRQREGETRADVMKKGREGGDTVSPLITSFITKCY